MDKEKDLKRETYTSDYDTLYGHLVSLQCDTAGKAVLMRHLERLYEAALESIDAASARGEATGLTGK